ncbi:MAG TPA: methyltransferase domain-containing protein [Actinocatenispora sp.]
MSETARFWDERYAEKDRIWSGEPNGVLVAEAADLPPGRALDLGCGEGADAIWLARRGWRVTGVDISAVALARAAKTAAAVGVADLIEWQRCDLADWRPDGAYDLVSAQFLHSPDGLPRDAVLRRAGKAVAPGGVLLVVGHAEYPEGAEHHPDTHFPTPDEVVADVDPAPGEWDVLVAEVRERTGPQPAGRPVAHRDSAVKLRRRTG